MITADWLIEHLGLEVLREEGGFYRETYKAGEAISREALPARYQGPRSFGTAIFYMLTPDSFSALHRLPTDEVYHFYLGDPVEMLLLHPDGHSERIILGSDLAAGQQVQFVAPAEVWQGSRLLPGGRYALMGTTMAPGFEFADYTGGIREDLVARYPDRAELIAELTH